MNDETNFDEVSFSKSLAFHLSKESKQMAYDLSLALAFLAGLPKYNDPFNPTYHEDLYDGLTNTLDIVGNTIQKLDKFEDSYGSDIAGISDYNSSFNSSIDHIADFYKEAAISASQLVTWLDEYITQDIKDNDPKLRCISIVASKFYDSFNYMTYLIKKLYCLVVGEELEVDMSSCILFEEIDDDLNEYADQLETITSEV